MGLTTGVAGLGRTFHEALAFLTPFGGAAVPGRGALRWFGVVGALIGAAVGTIWWGAAALFPPLVAAVIAVAADAALTGLLHLDGLSDSADGLLPPLPLDRRLAVMRDPHAGAFGVTALILALALRVAVFASLLPNLTTVLAVAAIWSTARTVMAVTTGTVPYARPGGLASAFVDRTDWRPALVVGLAVALPLGFTGTDPVIPGLLAVAATATTGALVVTFARGRIGGFTGDVLGAAGVLAECAGLVLLTVHAWSPVGVTGPVSRYAARAVAVAGALLADRLLGEPPVEPHPVALFGTSMTRLEHAIHRDDRRAGVLYTFAGVSAGTVSGLLLRSTMTATYVSVAGKALADAADAVAEPLVLGDLERARHLLPALVGRDARDLDVADIARAVVESVAENTTDAVVAPALWGAAGGAAATLAYRAVNTMDAMVGHRSARYARFGWASARLDDVANWVPARITALLVALARPERAGAVWRAVRHDAPAHPSPNSGVAEAAFAAALDLRLGGTNHYGDRVEHRPALGSGRAPEPGDIAAAVHLADEVQRHLTALLLITGAVSFITRRKRR